LDVYSLEQGQAEIMEGEVLDTSSLCGKSISESNLVDGISIGAIIHDDKVIYPTADTIIKSGDHVVLLAEKIAMKEIEQLFRVSSDYF